MSRASAGRANLIAWNKSQACRNKTSERNLKSWQDPVYERKMTRVLSRNRKKISRSGVLTRVGLEQMDRLWSDPKFKREHSKRSRKRCLLDNPRRNVKSPSKPQVSFFKRICRAGIKGFRLECSYERFCLDIADPVRKIDIEVDGEYWHSSPKVRARDRQRDRFLRRRGWKVLRIDTSRKEADSLLDSLRRML